MPTVQVDPTLTTYYEDDCFADPWRTPDPVLLIHGVAESSRAWTAWVPHLARDFRVLRPDNRGFGRSTVPPHAADYPWSPAAFAADLAHFLEALGVGAVHVVGAKLGGTIALQFAADYPARTKTLAIVSGPVRARGRGGAADITTFAERIRANGVRIWAEETQRARLGSAASAEQIAYWNDYMAATDPGVCIGVTGAAGKLDIYHLLPTIQAPTLVFTTVGSALQSVDTTRDWQQQIPNSELIVVESDSYHIAATKPDECAEHVRAFIQRNSGS